MSTPGQAAERQAVGRHHLRVTEKAKKTMDHTPLPKNKKKFPLFPGIKTILLGLLKTFLIVLCGIVISYVYLLYLAGYFRPHLDIDHSEIPIYTNAYDIQEQEPTEEGYATVYIWTFKSDDPPETVWKFYVGELGRKWHFHDATHPKILEKTLRVDSCPFYYVKMESMLINSTTYKYTVRFYKEYCM